MKYFLAFALLRSSVSVAEKVDPINLGCFQDDKSNRILGDGSYYGDSVRNSVEFCSGYCLDQDPQNKYFGLEAGFACFCGKEFDVTSNILKNGECTFACSGKSDQTCGGSQRIEVYEYVAEVENQGPTVPDYAPSGRFELGEAYITIDDTLPTISGGISFPSAYTSEAFTYDSTYWDMNGVDSPTSCVQGSSVTNTATSSPSNPSSAFTLDGVNWNDNKAVICVQCWSKVGDDKIDQVETLVTIYRTFTGQFSSLEVRTKTKDADRFADQTDENQLAVKAYLCDDSNNDITDQELAFVAGQDFNVCVEYDDEQADSGDNNNYVVTALKDVICSYGTTQDELVDENGDALGLTAVSVPGDIMSFTGVVKFSYIEDGDGSLTCGGNVDLEVASRRSLEETHSRALQTSEERVGSSTFSLGIKLDPTGSSAAAAASKGMVSMVLMGTAIALI